MSQWTDQMDRLLLTGNLLFGHVSSYRRPGFPAFSITGVPEFLDRLEDVNRGQFYSIFYRVADFEAAPFSASVQALFTGPPNADGVVTFDGLAYTDVATLDDSVPRQFLRGSSSLGAASNLAGCINADPAFSDFYSAATTRHPTCTATWDDNQDGTATVTVTYNIPGLVGDSVMADDAMSFVNLTANLFQGGGPLINDLVTLDGVLYRVSDVPEPDPEGGIQLRLEKKAL